MNSTPSLSLILFALNEEENLAPVLTELTEWLDAHEPEAEIIFVDDGSTDATLQEAQRLLAGRRVQFARHEVNRGIGAAIKTGVRQAHAPWVTFLPMDGQVEPSAIGALRQAARDDDVDVVLSVYPDRDDGAFRKVLSWGVRSLITVVHGVRLQSDGPYLFRRTLFDPEQLTPDTFFLNFEFPIRVAAAGLPAKTVTVRCRPRLAGQSKSSSFKHIVAVGRDLVDLRLRRLRGD